jgi:hypothetical protein
LQYCEALTAERGNGPAGATQYRRNWYIGDHLTLPEFATQLTPVREAVRPVSASVDLAVRVAAKLAGRV